MIWALIGLPLMVCALWAWGRWAQRDAVMRLHQAPDPFANREAMRRYHAALRPKRP